MVCMNPKIAYKRPSYPITGNETKRTLKRLNRLSFSYRKGWIQIELPCGECPACRLAHANEHATRIQCEAETWDNKGIFLTLTYNNPNLPMKDGLTQLCKPDVQKFKKKLRKYIAKHKEAFKSWINPITGKIQYPIRTFECGEYGTSGTRATIGGNPHYHMIIFNWIPQDLEFKQIDRRGYPIYTSKILHKLWGKGFCPIGTISYESASYVARYTMKKQGLAKVKREYYDAEVIDEETGEYYMTRKWHNKEGKQKPEFITMSIMPGIGYEYFQKNFETIKKNNGVLINVKGKVKLKSIPRYWRKLWERKDWEDYERWKYNNKKRIEKDIKKTIESYDLPKDMAEWQKENFYKIKILEAQNHKFGVLQERNNIEYDNNEFC